MSVSLPLASLFLPHMGLALDELRGKQGRPTLPILHPGSWVGCPSLCMGLLVGTGPWASLPAVLTTLLGPTLSEPFPYL